MVRQSASQKTSKLRHRVGELSVAYPTRMIYALGLDGGGTKTDCVLMDQSQKVVSNGRSGPSNPLRVGFGGALHSICEAADGAIREAGLTTADIAAVCTGLAGASQADAESKMRRLLSQEFPKSIIHVCTDLELTLEAAAHEDAVVLIAGTGSAAVGRHEDGRVARVGGHGPLLSDEGSAYDIGRRAAAQCMRDFDRNERNSQLGARILREMRVADWPEFRSRATAAPDEIFPRIFSVTAADAEAGNASAQGILRDAARDLAGLIADLVERLQLHDRKFVLVKSGGMIGRSKYFDGQVSESLQAVAPLADTKDLALNPAEAAARIALRKLAEERNGTTHSG
jgi:N-acetylglucosamine kinase-like BadF-type ATPase